MPNLDIDSVFPTVVLLTISALAIGVGIVALVGGMRFEEMAMMHE